MTGKNAENSIEELKNDAAAKFRRHNITLPQSAADRLTYIKEHTEAVSNSEVIRAALKLYEEVLKKEKDAV